MFNKKTWKKALTRNKTKKRKEKEETKKEKDGELSGKTITDSFSSQEASSRVAMPQPKAEGNHKSILENGGSHEVKPDLAKAPESSPSSKTRVDVSLLESPRGSPSHEIEHAHIEDPAVRKSYDSVPILETTKLPRGGISMMTEAVGRVQFGIPPETIKDSMKMGLNVPTVYIVPVERFCREMGPGLGVNLAEFEFPAYYNFFILRKKCTLIVDSDDAEQNIRRVFSETLLGPAQFRRENDPLTYEEEDFAPSFPREAIPNFRKELEHFRIMPDGKELVLETLIKFCHFNSPGESGVHQNLGIPPPVDDTEYTIDDNAASEERRFCEEEDFEEGALVPNNVKDVMRRESKRRWTYSHAQFDGDVATIYAPDSSTKRVEIFKMPGGTEYIIHDVDENNVIVGKARFSGHVRVSEKMSVAGFGEDNEEEDVLDSDGSEDREIVGTCRLLEKAPPTFHPPSFGVTVLGNSHGFDKSGSVSGYVLWINGRGVMIDPPPYSSATLEREGIRPRTIVGIILTHCHADHDAGAFQKVLTGSQVVVITTPTIYKSFIRKYAALSNLSPVLLRHSHRYKAAIIGTPLRFQGATFHFTYSLHSIPCVGFRVEWRGRSLVFTGDHLNSPPRIDGLIESGVLTKARADDLTNLPLQETDLLLHEAGAPPLHTPLDVLLKLPNRVKRRMYVVHTSALPEGCELRAAPTGTAGTIRLDQVDRSKQLSPSSSAGFETSFRVQSGSTSSGSGLTIEEDSPFSFNWNNGNEYEVIGEDSDDSLSMATSYAHLTGHGNGGHRPSLTVGQHHAPPLVSLRPASSTDAWFVLNLLSAVPFLTSLSYASTMEVLETARVDAFCEDDVVVPASMRRQVLCVIWEGTCVEREKGQKKRSSGGHLGSIEETKESTDFGTCAVWHAGDWTGPISVQPEKRLSGESALSSTHDVVAMSSEGVKVITIEFSSLHAILKSGSKLYKKYLESKTTHPLLISATSENDSEGPKIGEATLQELRDSNLQDMTILELLNTNYTFRKLSAVQKRHLESLAEGPVYYNPGDRLWRSGQIVEKAFIIVAGTVSFLPKRRNAGSVSWRSKSQVSRDGGHTLGESMRIDAMKAIKELRVRSSETSGENDDGSIDSIDKSMEESDGNNSLQLDTCFGKRMNTVELAEEDLSSMSDAHDYEKLSRGLQKRADLISRSRRTSGASSSCDAESLHSLHFEDSLNDEESHNDFDSLACEIDGRIENRGSIKRRRSSRARHANKVLGRLYSRRAFTAGLIFSRGHFLGDVSKMVAGLLSSDGDMSVYATDSDDGSSPKYGFGDDTEGGSAGDVTQSHGSSVGDMIIHEQEGGENVVHNSTLTAGKDGCVVLVFQKSSLIPFLDEYPGLLLSLLGTQVVV